MKRALAILCTAAPFVAAAIAAFGARHDLRLLWMGIVATALAWSMAMRGRGASTIILALILTSIATSAVAMLAGARAAFGIVATAVVVSAFATAGAFLNKRHTQPA